MPQDALPDLTAAAPPGSPEALLQAALDWGARGFRVFPLVPEGKTPAFEGWQQSATTDPDTIRSMWSEMTGLDAQGRVVPRPMPYNVGYVTDHLVVIDIDTKKDPNAHQIYQDELLGDFDTLEVRTTSGGTHLIYSWPAGDRATRVNLEDLPIDIKARGGLAVAPGSVFANGFYRLAADRPVKLAPPHIIKRLGQYREKTPFAVPPDVVADQPHVIALMTNWLSAATPAAKGGRGYANLKWAFELHDYGVSPEVATTLLLENFGVRCDPPMALEPSDNDDQGVICIVANAYEHAQNPFGCKLTTLAGVKFSAPPPPPATDVAPVPVDLSVLRLNRRPPPPFPLDVLGTAWAAWATDAASASAAPVDYVVAPLLSAASALIGNARWARAGGGWVEPPHVWCGVVGESGTSKSPAADPLMRHVIPAMEQRMLGDFPDRLREFKARSEVAEATREQWAKEVRLAAKAGNPPPLPPVDIDPVEPEAPRLRLNDSTIEKVSMILATASPKGVLMTRDELAGFLLGMNNYNEGARAFWLEAYGGRPYRVERVKTPAPINIRHLAVSWFGGTQPERLAEMLNGSDDGLLARFAWFWPDPVPFRMTKAAPNLSFAIDAFDRLRALEMATGSDGAEPVYASLEDSALPLLVTFAQEMQERQQSAGGLMRSALGKARGLALRLALVIEFLWWSAAPGFAPPPRVISQHAMGAAIRLVSEYLMPMAERVYGDAAAKPVERNAATLARWIAKTRPAEVHVRTLQRQVRLPGLTDAAAIHAACAELVEAGWLSQAPGDVGFQKRPRAAYAIVPELWRALP